MGPARQSGGVDKQSRKKEKVRLDVGQIWVCYRNKRKTSVFRITDQEALAQYDTGNKGRNKIIQKLESQRTLNFIFLIIERFLTEGNEMI